jgi:hypothetical protein
VTITCASAVDDGDVGAGPQLEMVIGLDVRRLDHLDGARIDHDQLRALTQAALHLRSEHRMWATPGWRR